MARTSDRETVPTRWIWEELRQEVSASDATCDRVDELVPNEEELERTRVDAYAAGHHAGETEANEDLVESIHVLNNALERIREAQKQWADAVEANLLAVSTAIARHIIERELQGDPESFAELVRSALAKFPVDEAVKVRVNPRDLSAISMISDAGGLAIPIEGTREVHWIADQGILTGGCVVEGPKRVVDGRVDAALERIYKVLIDG